MTIRKSSGHWVANYDSDGARFAILATSITLVLQLVRSGARLDCLLSTRGISFWSSPSNWRICSARRPCSCVVASATTVSTVRALCSGERRVIGLRAPVRCSLPSAEAPLPRSGAGAGIRHSEGSAAHQRKCREDVHADGGLWCGAHGAEERRDVAFDGGVNPTVPERRLRLFLRRAQRRRANGQPAVTGRLTEAGVNLRPDVAGSPLPYLTAQDRTGNPVANAYRIAHEEATNDDYQDMLFTLSNVMPAPPADAGTSPTRRRKRAPMPGWTSRSSPPAQGFPSSAHRSSAFVRPSRSRRMKSHQWTPIVRSSARLSHRRARVSRSFGRAPRSYVRVFLSYARPSRSYVRVPR